MIIKHRIQMVQYMRILNAVGMGFYVVQHKFHSSMLCICDCWKSPSNWFQGKTKQHVFYIWMVKQRTFRVSNINPQKDRFECFWEVCIRDVLNLFSRFPTKNGIFP